MNPHHSTSGAAVVRSLIARCRARFFSLLPLILSLLTGCAGPKTGAASGAGARTGGGALPVVGVLNVAPTSAELTEELPGRASPYRIAEVRARVNGIVTKRLFAEGSDVKEGQVLFEIDPAPYAAALASARATLAHAEANLISAHAQSQRYAKLIGANAISQQDYDNAVAVEKADEADVASGKASVATAEIDLGYTTVTSPVSGRAGRSSVTEGALVQQSQATLMVTVQQLDPIYVDLTQSSATWLQERNAIATGRLQGSGQDAASVRLFTEDGRAYPLPGVLQSSDATVDMTTGSLVLRALFANPDHTLLPGMYVRARVASGKDPEAILVPQIAVSRNDRGDASVLVVDAQGKVEPQPIVADRTEGNSWLVSKGLKPGDRVIVEGIQQVRPGIVVKAVPAKPAPGVSMSSGSSPAVASAAQ